MPTKDRDLPDEEVLRRLRRGATTEWARRVVRLVDEKLAEAQAHALARQQLAEDGAQLQSELDEARAQLRFLEKDNTAMRKQLIDALRERDVAVEKLEELSHGG